jgi:hypothetical protein
MKLVVTINGETSSDLIDAMNEVMGLLNDDYLSGQGSNETGDFDFDITE